ncbi:type II secretion system F family protein [Acholeplasma equirhinis]|uniref:type II secretion system F family protein n=1 Tax=Acholeplasma equirhinis TaxID=555393 RepID=UPI00197AB029|nr:type II secretion system F family protein [Acholeplasma equirhinis]MBN3489911.1 type II secretion system F family protein [Acholeplasma equirhinis]
MPYYTYKAQDLSGKQFKGETDAFDENDLKVKLKKQNLHLVDFKLKVNKGPNMFLQVSSTPSKNEVVLFIRQLSIMVSAGISVEDAVKTINNQTKSGALKNILIKVEEELYKGSLFSEALAKFPKVFPAYFRNMIYIGEVSGQLPKVLIKAADFYERDAKLKRKASTAIVYPAFLFVAIIAVFIFLITFIVPSFETTLTQMNAELPAITRFVLDLSHFLTRNWVYLLGGFIILIALIFIWFKTKSGKYVKDWLKLNIPVIKKVNFYLITTRFSKGLSVLVSSGLNVMDSIGIIGKLMDNVVFEAKFQYVIDEIKRGKKIHRSIEHISFFPPMLIEMINVGESTGNLDEVLDITSLYYDEVLETTISKATQLLEPTMVVFAGGLVGFVILSIFLPMISMMSSI